MISRALSRTTLLLGAVIATSCADELDTSRSVPARGSVGRELYTLVCDRVGAQALREDVTGASFRGVCRPDAKGVYAATVDATKLPPIDSSLTDVAGKVVTVDQQKKNRAYRIARIEALGRRREDLIAAFDNILPDVPLALRDTSNADPAKTCDLSGQKGALLHELAESLSRMVDLYEDRTIPMMTDALGRLMLDVRGDKEIQNALARMDARKGYRPPELALGVVRPLLSYDRLVDLVDALLRVVASNADPYGPAVVPGKAHVEMQAMLRVLHEELRTASSDPAPATLTVAVDTLLAGKEVLSRPRTTLELSRRLLTATDPDFGIVGAPKPIVRRDLRAFAAVPLVAGKVPAPFVDADGDGLPDLDPLGQFVSGTTAPATPFPAFEGADGKRDALGLALQATGDPLYVYLDTSKTFAGSVVKNLRPLVEPDPKKTPSATVMKLLAGVPIVAGPRDASPTAERTYPPDPARVTAWKAARKDPPPANLGTQPVSLKYRAFQADKSAIVDLVHALGQIMARQEVDEALALFRKLLAEKPQQVARLVGVGLQLKAIADKHPEASLPENSLLWDELLDVVVQIAQTPGILEDLLKAFADPRTVKLQTPFVAYMKYKDQLTYNRKDLNGPTFNATTGSVGGFVTPVDRSQPDSGKNRSALQRFMQLLHDANGLGACTKDNAIAHIDIQWPAGSGIPVKLDYPTNILSKAVCAFVGQSAPTRIPACGILRFENVAALLLDVALDRAKFDVRDKCLAALMASPLTGIVGGTDAFLEQASGVKGFNTHPTVAGIARMVYFDTPHDGLPGDTTNAKTSKFFAGVLDPVPSMACSEAPFTDPSDGKVIKLRKCASFADTIRGRDEDALFPLEVLDFVKNVQPLAAAFADHGKPLYFVDLFDTLHRHWGSNKQTKAECDPSLPKTDARWCSQDGAVTYEPLLAEMLESDLFPTLFELVTTLKAMKVPHCEAFDPKSHQCTKAIDRDGVTVLAEAVRVLVDPARSPGLKDRRGNAFALRNDGTKNPQLTPIYLFIDGLHAVDKAFLPDPARKDEWRKARSEIVDQFFTVDGAKDTAAFREKALPKILPLVLDVTRAQIAAHCPDPTASCPWAEKDLAASLSSVLEGPTFAAGIDLVDALRKDPATRAEVLALAAYLLDAASGNDAQSTSLAALVDLLQTMDDDVNLTPLYRVLASATAENVVDESGKVVMRGLADGALEVLARLFARPVDASGGQICNGMIDPHRATDYVLKRLFLPFGTGKDLRTPFEVIASVVADVNRLDPNATSKLTGPDYANMAKEVAEMCLHPSRGLPQIYEVIRQATKK